MRQVLGEPQDQQQMPPATAQAPAGHGEGSDFWLTGWSAACESPSPEHVEPHLGSTGRTYSGQLPNGYHASTIIMTKSLLQDLHCMQALLQDPTHSANDKHSFWRNYFSDNKFTWLSVQETHTYSKSAKEEHSERWLSRYQVAAEEKLPPDSALLQELLDQPPSRAHRTASWAAKGEREYYYQAQGQIALSASTDHQLMAIRQG